MFRHPTTAAKRLALLAIAGGACLAPLAAEAGAKDFKIPKAVAIAGANAFAAGIEINLDNWGKFKGSGGGTWQENNSYVLMPSGSKKSFVIPRSGTVQTGTRRYNAYIDNMTSQTIDVKADGDMLKIRVFFESAGDEIRIGCINRLKDKPCKAHLLKHTGDINNAHIYAWLKPTFSGSRIGFAPVDLSMDFDFKLDSKALDLVKNAANYFVDIKGKTRSAAKSAFMTSFAAPSAQQAMSKDLNKALIDKMMPFFTSKMGSGAAYFIQNQVKITKVFSSGSDYVVRVSYPDPIGPNSVKITKFAPKSKKLTAKCPFNYGFNATIEASAKTSGKAWLILQGGKTSKKVNWSMPKAGSASSVISFKAKGQAGKSYQGGAKLALTWTGNNGQSYQTVSSLQGYQYTCSKAVGGFASQ